MARQEFFPKRPACNPMIYAYEDTNPQYNGLLKIGYTTVDVKQRVAQQYPTLRPGTRPYRIVFEASAMRSDGTSFMDFDVHRYLRRRKIENPNGEWFRCTVGEVKAAVRAVRDRTENAEMRTEDFAMRPEQEDAVNRTETYIRNFHQEFHNNKTPHYLWNCKMRFGKTFAAYQLAKRMEWKRILVLTFKPAVENAWRDDLLSHQDFEGWQFIARDTELDITAANKKKPIVCFGSFQDYLGTEKDGSIKAKNEWVHLQNWDCVILDEYHFGAWRENAKNLFDTDVDAAEEQKLQDKEETEGLDPEYNHQTMADMMPITTNAYLYLSGTPFRAINSGEFIEDQIYSWTYSDEQRAKDNWPHEHDKQTSSNEQHDKGAGQGEDNPYAALPRMVMMTYQMPDEIRRVATAGEFDEFDLNVFFSAEGKDEEATFKYKDEVQKWLNLIRGAYSENIVSDLKLRTERPPMPFSHAPLLSSLTHTLWFLPTVAACYAMGNLLKERQNMFYHDYQVIVAAGTKAGIGVNALYPVLQSMGNPLKTKTITLSCGKLTTGVSVKPWSGIFMLRNSSSPETYFQAAFRVQTPWTVKNPDDLSPNKTEILKKECYVFDFAPNRALRQIADYSCRLNVEESDPERNVAEFINFLPVLAYDGSSMKRIDAAGILDIALSGTSATLLARRWESALLVNVDNDTLRRLMGNGDAMKALENIEGFRNLNQDIETIINKSEAVKKAKKEHDALTVKEKRELTQEEKEYKSMRKKIQEKLIKFATRVPVFMYLTDYRERCLKDVITELEPGLFKKVTGLGVKDFDLLVSLNVFNSSVMNDAIFKFKRYEDSSLEYAGINRHKKDEAVGLYDTAISPEEYKQTFLNIS